MISSPRQQRQPSACSSTRRLLKRCRNRRAKCFTTTMVRLLLFPSQHTYTHHSFYDERLLGCKFLQYLSEAQNHADKFLVAFLLIELYHTSHLTFHNVGETVTNSLFSFRSILLYTTKPDRCWFSAMSDVRLSRELETLLFINKLPYIYNCNTFNLLDFNLIDPSMFLCSGPFPGNVFLCAGNL